MAGKKELHTVHSKDIDLSLLRNDDLPPDLLPVTYNITEYNGAILDPGGLEDTATKSNMRLCTLCRSDLKKGKMPKFALCNWLYYARDRLPPDVKKGFQIMSVFEKALICRVRTNSLLCRFSLEGAEKDPFNDSFVQRRRHIRGNVISTPLDVARINEVLPPSASDVRDTICALIVSATVPSTATLDTLTPILVRKSRLKLLIKFLVERNPYYTKCESFKGFSSEYLDQLFSGTNDTGVPAAVVVGHIPINRALESLTEDYTGRMDDMEGLVMENVAYTSGDHSPQNYRDMALEAVERCREGKPFLHSRSGSVPVPDINNPAWLTWAHPNADPFGIGGFNHPKRKRPIGMEQQLRHLLTANDPFFERDSELAFDVYNIIRKSAVNTSIRFAVPYSRYSATVNHIASLNKELVAALRHKFQKNPNYTPTNPDETKILRVLASIGPLARKIPGTVSQKIKMRNEIRAIISQKGSPTLFVTVNPSDYHNPIVSVLATRPTSEAAAQALRDMTSSDRGHLAVDHPVACAQFFDIMMKSFIRILLRHGRKGGPGIFGYCDAYYGTVETQGRGTLHCHMLIWLKGHLPPETLAATLKSSSEYGAALIKWIDSIMYSGFIGSKTILNDLPCEGDGEERAARDPHPASKLEPQVVNYEKKAFTLEMNDHVDELLTRFNWHKHTGSCWKYLKPGDPRIPENCRFGMDGVTSNTTTVDQTEGTIAIRRLHPKMTHYNPSIIFLLKCNTDIKFIGSGSDAKAFMYYVTDYITKAPLSMHAGLTALAYAIKQGDDKKVLRMSDNQEADPRRAVTIAINSMLGRQELSHPQVMSYVLGGGEYYTSERFQAVNWSEVIRYITGTQSGLEITRAPPDPTPAIDDLSLAMTDEDGSMTASNSLLDYIFRPTSEPYNSMGFYNHIATTKRTTRKKTPNSTTAATAGAFSSNKHPQFTTHYLGSRTHHVIPVLLGPAIARRHGNDSEQESWARDMCILFSPWRIPADVIPTDGDWKKKVNTVCSTLSEQDQRVLGNMALVAEGRQARDEKPRNRHKGISDQALLCLDDLAGLDPAEPVAQTNVYAAALDVSNDGSTEPGSNSKIAGYLDDLLGQGSSWAIQRCFPTSGSNPAIADLSGDGANPDEDPTYEVANDSLISDQRKYMTRARGKKRPRDETKENGQNKSRKRRKRLPREQDPRTEVATLSERANNLRPLATARLQMEMADTLAESRGIRSNPEQYRAYMAVARHATYGGPQLLMYIGGEGGTGKSYLIESIVMLFKALNREREVRLGAFTGIAATLIGGNTIHSLLSIGTSFKNPAALTKRLISEWGGVKYMFVDEVSMISAQFLAAISAKLQLARSDHHTECQKMFGGVNMVFLGDFFQLAPPNQAPLFAYSLVRNPSFMDVRSNLSINAISGAYLWRQVSQVVILKQTKRHEGDPHYAKLLNLIRSRQCIGSDGRQQKVDGLTVIEHLRLRDIEYVTRTNPDAIKEFQEAPVIVGNRLVRDLLNSTMLKAHADRSGNEVHIYYSKDFIKSERVEGPAADFLWSLSAKTTKDAFGQLPMFIGMRVMITENVSVRYKVVNGSEGVITAIHHTEENNRRYAKVVYVKIAASKHIQAPGLGVGIVPIFPTSTTIAYPTRFRSTVSKTFSRQQLPLVPAYSYTDYKSQGRTLDRAIVDLASAKQQGVYVMLSRVKSIAGILILRWFPESKILQEMTGELREEILRLDSLDAASEMRDNRIPALDRVQT
ncbi:hypothetical protein D9611_011328 [Ephemerocybe angulata]|uniref:ATP-dependent DNA helicase n=1 Tax=Ephemerocybe angulata TaxID=980116 RepID=A0A8H5BBU8_9AGAR|nr:hypothetical protein D9611_011328 [Tulosesus angulatus]